MTFIELKDLIEGIGLPCAYYQFEKDTAKPPPFIVWFVSQDNDLLADDRNYQKIAHIIIELYTETKDFELEATVEAHLTEHLSWSRAENFIEDEKLHQTVYETEVVIHVEQ